MSRQSFGSVRRLRSGRWQARYCNGLGERIPAPQTFATKTDARRWLAGVETDLARGTYVDPRAGKMLFATWADAWLNSKPHKRAATLARDSTAIDTHFKPLLGTMALAKITPCTSTPS